MSKIKKILVAIGGFFAAVFYVLFKEKKEERLIEQKKELEADAERLKAEAIEIEKQSETLLDAVNKGNEERKEIEKKIASINGATLNSYNTTIDFLRQ